MVSAIILSKNSEKSISITLESLQWCDEIIVIDDYSTDKTASIARAKKATVYTHHLNDDFAAQRNFGLSKVRHNWVLYVDSDERVSRELASEINAVISDTKLNGFYLRRQDTVFGKTLRHGETQNVRLLRLAQKGAGSWSRPVHETWEIAGEVGELNHPLLHEPHPTITEFIADIDRYSTVNAQHFYLQGVRSSAFQILVYPVAKFLQNYILRLGFLDGTAGIVVAILMSFHSFLTRAKLYVLQKNTS